MHNVYLPNAFFSVTSVIPGCDLRANRSGEKLASGAKSPHYNEETMRAIASSKLALPSR